MNHTRSIYFIADLHLDPERLQELQFALAFLEQVHRAQALYILGDLFEYWIGDDAGLAMYPQVIEALASLSASGCRIVIMHGNRDFLLGDTFAQATGAQLLRQDELVLELGSKPILLMHGDTLCTDDTDYQRFRAQVRNTTWQQEFLAQSIDQRLQIAEHLRTQSREKSAGKSVELMDVNQSQVNHVMATHHCQTLIHGHTHRPDVHTDRAQNTRRLVVGDWHADYADYAISDDVGLHLKRFHGQLDIPAPSA